jgi:hypothetical protein
MTGRHGPARDPLRLRLWDTFWLWRGGGVTLRQAWHLCFDPAPAPRAPADRDWGESRLPGAAERTGQLEAIRCRMELCAYWPGDGCMRGVMPCDDDDADPEPFETDDEFIDSVRHLLPPGSCDLLPETLAPLPELPAEYLPARVIGDVPTGLIEFQGEVSPELLASFREAFSIRAPDETSVDGMRPVPAGISDREFVAKVRRTLAGERAALAAFIAEVDHAVLSEGDALVETTLAALEHGLAVARG